jgi:hypothetical protein
MDATSASAAQARPSALACGAGQPTVSTTPSITLANLADPRKFVFRPSLDACDRLVRLTDSADRSSPAGSYPFPPPPLLVGPI